MKVESKSSSALRKDGRRDETGPSAPVRAACVFLPVVEQNVRSPDLVGGETEVFHPGMLALVPLEVVVEPALKHTHTRCGRRRTGGRRCSRCLGFWFTGTRNSHKFLTTASPYHPEPDVSGEDLVLFILRKMKK